MTIQAKGEISLHEADRPRGLDWVKFTALDGQDMPEVLAIYELDGDTLRVCNGGPNNDRPKEFKPGDGALADVVVFRREKVRNRSRRSRSRPWRTLPCPATIVGPIFARNQSTGHPR